MRRGSIMFRLVLSIIVMVLIVGIHSKNLRAKKASWSKLLSPPIVKRDGGTACGDKFFDCGSYCIPSVLVCDTGRDCRGGQDEQQNCPTDCTGVNQFKCSSGECIPGTYRCDHDTDCKDGSDEQKCEGACSGGHFQCKSNNYCIPDVWHCDGEGDCEDNSDEADCGSGPCSSGQFTCKNGKCLAKEFRCDEKDDCGDNSDENGCV